MSSTDAKGGKVSLGQASAEVNAALARHKQLVADVQRIGPITSKAKAAEYREMLHRAYPGLDLNQYIHGRTTIYGDSAV